MPSIPGREQDLPWLGSHAVSSSATKDQGKRAAGGAAIVQSALDQFANDLPPEFRELDELYVERYREIGRLYNEGVRISATTTAAMGSAWQPAEVGRRATIRTTQAIIDLDVLGLLRERLER